MKLGLTIAVAAGLFLSQAANAAEIKILGAGATKETLVELIPEFEKDSGHKVVAKWSGTVDIKKRIAAGEVYDIVTVPGPEIDALVQQ
ncbi:substrate-binding domain-containing protein [Bradyrhizobium sp.]|uniref:substrate-binding domain-containing protein n=1 Tax=Bradyrhizobium sp. TaxID=376 RepID=UPI003C44ECBD